MKKLRTVAFHVLTVPSVIATKWWHALWSFILQVDEEPDEVWVCFASRTVQPSVYRNEWAARLHAQTEGLFVGGYDVNEAEVLR